MQSVNAMSTVRIEEVTGWGRQAVYTKPHGEYC